ncbi:MAG: PAS domain S-box protein [Candidatus Kryptoniota bacterium]
MKHKKVLRGTSPKSGSSEEAFGLLFHHHPIPMWVYDLKTLAFLDVNHAAVEKYDYTREEFFKMTLIDLRPPEDITHLLDNLAEMRPELQHSGQWLHRIRSESVYPEAIQSERGASYHIQYSP